MDNSLRSDGVRDWSKLFDASKNQSLEFFPPKKTSSSVRVVPPMEVFEEGVDI